MRKNRNGNTNSDSYYEEDEYCDERLSLDEAADIWVCSGEDEDYMFGYSEEELRREVYGSNRRW